MAVVGRLGLGHADIDVVYSRQGYRIHEDCSSAVCGKTECAQVSNNNPREVSQQLLNVKIAETIMLVDYYENGKYEM